MRCKVQIIMETEAGEAVQEIACLDRDAQGIEDIGLTLAEAKTLLLEMQQAVVGQQLADYLKQRQNCPECGKACLSKGAHSVVFRTLFSNLERVQLKV